jgi:hypothetical protein
MCIVAGSGISHAEPSVSATGQLISFTNHRQPNNGSFWVKTLSDTLLAYGNPMLIGEYHYETFTPT